MSDILNEMKQSIIDMKHDETAAQAQKALDEGTSAIDILNKSLVPALDEVGVLFREGDYFLPDVLMCVKSYENAYRHIEPLLIEGGVESKGKVLIGTVEGDIHEIGKNILIALLQGNGFEVIDLGPNVKPEAFLEKAKEVSPDIIGMSALLSTTMPVMKDVIDLFGKEGVRDNYKFIVGGSPLNQKFADEIGADGYGQDAQSGVDLVKHLLAS